MIYLIYQQVWLFEFGKLPLIGKFESGFLYLFDMRLTLKNIIQ